MDLTRVEIELLLESLNYSIRSVSEAQGTPDRVRGDNLDRLRAVQEKLRRMRDQRPESS
jgi:hypothetical protein